MKAVSIFHQELARPQNAEPGTLFIPKLGLDLVDRQRHLTMAAEMPGHQVRDDFFMRRAESEVNIPIATSDIEVDQHISERFFPPCPLEQVNRLQRRHQNFQRPGRIHFLSHDRLGLFQGTNPQRQVGVGTRHQLANKTGTQHQLMTGNFCIRRDFFHRRDKCLRPAHGRLLISRESGFRGEAGVYSEFDAA